MAAPSRLSRLATRLSLMLPMLITLGLAVIGAAAGFRHTHDWAESNGQHGWFAWADAVVIECMCLVAGFEIHRDRKAGRSARFPLTVLMVGFLIQMTAQVAEAKPTPAGWLLAATTRTRVPRRRQAPHATPTRHHHRPARRTSPRRGWRRACRTGHRPNDADRSDSTCRIPGHHAEPDRCAETGHYAGTDHSTGTGVGRGAAGEAPACAGRPHHPPGGRDPRRGPRTDRRGHPPRRQGPRPDGRSDHRHTSARRPAAPANRPADQRARPHLTTPAPSERRPL